MLSATDECSVNWFKSGHTNTHGQYDSLKSQFLSFRTEIMTRSSILWYLEQRMLRKVVKLAFIVRIYESELDDGETDKHK